MLEKDLNKCFGCCDCVRAGEGCGEQVSAEYVNCCQSPFVAIGCREGSDKVQLHHVAGELCASGDRLHRGSDLVVLGVFCL